MSEQAKRYHWLKLQIAYFSQLEQKKMSRQPNGKDMQIIYLRMMLLSINKGGYIYYQGVYDSLEEELAEEFNEPVETIRATLEYLKQNNMITINENSDCFMPEAVACAGSECYSAERVRRYREKKALQCNSNVTPGNGDVTAGNEEKEKDIDINTLCAPTGAQKGSRQVINDLFERVWKLYPNKKGKGQVSDSKKKELYNVGYEELSRAIDRYKEGLKADEWRKPQNGSTFFNRGYIDYLDRNYEGQQAHEAERPHYVSEYAQEEEEFMKGVKWDGPFK